MGEITEYTVQDEQHVKDFYISFENKKRWSRILHALQHRDSAKWMWKAGMVGIVSIQFMQWMKSQFVLKSMVWQLLLWSAGLGIAWLGNLNQEYTEELAQSSIELTTTMKHAKAEKSNAWIIKSSGSVVGTVAFEYGENEGRISCLTGVDKSTRLALLQHAFQFGKQHDIKVISKSKNIMFTTKWSEDLF